MEIGLNAGDFVLDGDPVAPLPEKGGGHSHPPIRPYLLWRNGWMHQDTTYTCTEPCTRQCIHHMAVYTGRVRCHQWTQPVYTAVWCTHCRVHMPKSRPYTRRVHGRVHGHVRAVYTVAVYTAVYTARTRPRPVYTAVYTVVYTTLFTAHLQGRAHGP